MGKLKKVSKKISKSSIIIWLNKQHADMIFNIWMLTIMFNQFLNFPICPNHGEVI